MPDLGPAPDPDDTVDRLTQERDVLLQTTARLRYIIERLHYMARRYADGRHTTAPDTFNYLIHEAISLGCNIRRINDYEDIWARRGTIDDERHPDPF